MLVDPKHPSTAELMADPWFSRQILEWWKVQQSAEVPLSTPACITEMRRAYEQAAVAAGSGVGEPELFTPFDPGIASPCPQCKGDLLPQCACLSNVCVAIRDNGVRDRRRAKDAACAQPTVQCKQCTGLKTSARAHCLSSQCVTLRAAKALNKHASGAKEVSGKRKGKEGGPAGAKKHAATPTIAVIAVLPPASAHGPSTPPMLGSSSTPDAQPQPSAIPGLCLGQQDPGLGKRRSDNAVGKQIKHGEAKSQKASRKDGIANQPPARASKRANAGINKHRDM